MTTVKSVAGSLRTHTLAAIGLLFAGLAQAQSLNWEQTSLSRFPSARCCVGMAYDAATHSTVLFGGGNGGINPLVTYNDTWVWHNGWFQRNPPTFPSARQSPAMAYDVATGNVVLFGGTAATGEVLGDTWIWDGLTWTQQFPPLSPPARNFSTQAMAYYAVTGTLLLFGGNGNTGVFDDTWEWNGRAGTWTQRYPASRPSPRLTTLAYDTANKQIVLFGGSNGQAFFNDTWTWDGLTWTQHLPASSPSARVYNSLVYDPTIRQVVLYGGFLTPGVGLNDTWTWNEITWTRLAPSNNPGGLWAAGTVFDPITGGLVLFGGEVTGDPFSSNTSLFVPAP